METSSSKAELPFLVERVTVLWESRIIIIIIIIIIILTDLSSFSLFCGNLLARGYEFRVVFHSNFKHEQCMLHANLAMFLDFFCNFFNFLPETV